jgi:hypothetical protein
MRTLEEGKRCRNLMVSHHIICCAHEVGEGLIQTAPCLLPPAAENYVNHIRCEKREVNADGKSKAGKLAGV